MKPMMIDGFAKNNDQYLPMAGKAIGDIPVKNVLV
jgi:hypothetical protein